MSRPDDEGGLFGSLAKRFPRKEKPVPTNHTPECHLKASQGIPDRWHCPAHCPVEQERVARANIYLDATMSTDADLDAYRKAILRSVREKVAAMSGPPIPKSRMPNEGDVFVERSAVLALLDTEEGT